MLLKYEYSGPVTEFGKLIQERWIGSTYAESEKQARSNLAYQFKKNNNRLPTARIGLPGKLVIKGA